MLGTRIIVFLSYVHIIGVLNEYRTCTRYFDSICWNFAGCSIISMPLHAGGVSKGKSLVLGILSGIVEPIGAVLTILAAELVIPVLPYLLSFATGAMMYVVVEELIPEMSEGKHSNIGVLAFALGFTVMMILDVALG